MHNSEFCIFLKSLFFFGNKPIQQIWYSKLLDPTLILEMISNTREHIISDLRVRNLKKSAMRYLTYVDEWWNKIFKYTDPWIQKNSHWNIFRYSVWRDFLLGMIVGGPCEHNTGLWGLSSPLWSEWEQIITLTNNRHLSPCTASFAPLTKWSCQLRVASDMLPTDWRVSKTSITGLFLWQKNCVYYVYLLLCRHYNSFLFRDSWISQSLRLSCYEMND